MRLRLFRYMALADVQAGECDVAYTGHGKRRRSFPVRRDVEAKSLAVASGDKEVAFRQQLQ